MQPEKKNTTKLTRHIKLSVKSLKIQYLPDMKKIMMFKNLYI